MTDDIDTKAWRAMAEDRLRNLQIDAIYGGLLDCLDALDALREENRRLREALTKIDTAEKACNYERDIDCDWPNDPKKCSREVGCHSIEQWGGNSIQKTARLALSKSNAKGGGA